MASEMRNRLLVEEDFVDDRTVVDTKFDRYAKMFNRDMLIWIGIFTAGIVTLIVLLSLTFVESKHIKRSVDVLYIETTDNILLNDIAVLNFALGAEDLESAGYQAITSAIAGLSSSTYTSSKGDVLNGTNIVNIISKLGGEEAAHANALRTVYIPNLCSLLSPAKRANCGPIQPCQYSFGLTPVNNAAGYTAAFNLGMTMEQVGEGAYIEAMGLIKSPEVRKVAAGILSVESEHTALLRYILGNNPSPSTVVPPLSVNQVLCAASAFVSNANTCAPWKNAVC